MVAQDKRKQKQNKMTTNSKQKKKNTCSFELGRSPVEDNVQDHKM